MHTASLPANPFALLTDPESILRAIEGSQRLDGLNRRICRPLDRAPRGEGEGEAEGAEQAAVASRDASLDHTGQRWG